MIDGLITAGVSFVYVGLRSFQQLNVVHRQYLKVLPTSFAMAAADVYLIALIASRGWNLYLVALYGLGAGLGAMTAMRIQHSGREREERAGP